MKTKQHRFAWLVDTILVKRSDTKIVFVSIFAATLFWLLNALNKDYSTRLAYNIQFDVNDSLYVAVTPPPKRVLINVFGNGWNLLRKSIQLRAEPLTYPLPNPTAVKYIVGNSLLPVIQDQLEAEDVRVNYVATDTLFLDYDRIARKRVALRVDSAQISLARNHWLVSPVSVNPDTLIYTGPVSLLKALPDAIYLEVPTRNIDENFQDEIPINYVQSTLIQANHNQTEIQFDVARFVRESKKTRIQLFNMGENRKSFHLADSIVDVSYWVRADDAGRTRAEDFRIAADFDTFNKQDSTVMVSVEQSPDFVRNIALSKTTARIHPVAGTKNGK